MFNLMPKDEGFFDFFERAAQNVHTGATLLDELMRDYRDVDERAKQIRNVEHQGDHLTRESIEKLNRTFIAPFDRESIHELVTRMDDVLDGIENATNRMVVYRVTAPTPDAQALAKVLVKCTGTLVSAMPLLRDLKRPQEILNLCLEVHTQESEADRIEHHGLATLFDKRQDPIEVIKWKDIYGDLEQATDRCADVANALEQIVIRNS